MRGGGASYNVSKLLFFDLVGRESYNVTLEHVERERNYCSVAHELKVPFTAVDANCSKCSRARESRRVRFSKECKHEQHGRRVDALSVLKPS